MLHEAFEYSMSWAVVTIHWMIQVVRALGKTFVSERSSLRGLYTLAGIIIR